MKTTKATKTVTIARRAPASGKGAVVVRELTAKSSPAWKKGAVPKGSGAPPRSGGLWHPVPVASVTKAAVKTAAAVVPKRTKRVASASRWNTAELMFAAPASATMPRVLRTLKIGESQVLDFVGINRAAIGNPAIADIAILSGNQMLINGKMPGETTLFVWDRRGQTRYDITVVAETVGASTVVDRVRRDINDPLITVRAVGDTLMLEGAVPTQQAAMRAEAIATAYYRNVRNLIRVEMAAAPAVAAAPARTAEQAKEEVDRALTGIPVTTRVVNESTLIVEGSVTADVAERVRRVIGALGGGVQILDMLSVGKPALRQTLVRTRVVEINKTKTKNLGVDWGRVRFQNDANGTTTATVSDQPFLIGQTDLSPTSILEGGPLRKLDPIGARIQALVNDNAARILSEPNMFVLEGQRGNILIGGEIPIPVSQAAGIGTAISVDWKQFGIQLAVEPMTIDGDMVTMRVAPEVSSLDFGNAITASGITIPALRSRRAESVINVRNGQTIVLGGLLQNESANVVRRIPLVSRIPIIGELFKSRQFVRGETELVILVTPEIVEPGQAPNVPVPKTELKRPE